MGFGSDGELEKFSNKVLHQSNAPILQFKRQKPREMECWINSPTWHTINPTLYQSILKKLGVINKWNKTTLHSSITPKFLQQD